MVNTDLIYAALKLIKYAGLPEPSRTDSALLKHRRLRWDLIYDQEKLAIELQGQVWHKGGHSTGSGIIRDCQKANLLTLYGWRGLWFTTDMIENGEMVETLEKLLIPGSAGLPSRSPTST